MVEILVVGLILLGCLLVATCVTVLTFTVVDMRRTGVAMAARLESLGQRNYDVMSSTNEIVRRLELKIDVIEERLVTPDPDQ